KIDSVVTAHGWPRGGGALYFLYTPLGVGSRLGSTSYAYVKYCAYHSNFDLGSGNTLYAVQPFTKGATADGTHLACEAVSEYPNGAATGADPTISVISHEHNEAITDPRTAGWYDDMGYENGDKCAWSFGTMAGVAGSRYNQVVGGHHYLTQTEWSNAGATLAQKCVGSMPVLHPTVTSISPNTGAIGSAVVINGTGFGGVSAVRFHGTASVFSVASGMKIYARVPAGATTGKITVTTPAGTASSFQQYTVLPPTISGFTPGSGKTGTVVTINGTNLAGVNSVKNGLMPMTILANGTTWMTARIKDWGTYNPLHPITVSSSAGSATSAANFAVTFGISNVNPTSGGNAAVVTISGRGFNGTSRVGMVKDPTPLVVPFSVASNGTSLTFLVPNGWFGAHQLYVTNSLGVTGTVYSYWTFTKT
ncbi:MAG: large repetitive protein, partial [Gaiellaceae bacterium]|nr:large repetitive protein [Gaiellaceae bacterium]